MKLLYVIFQYHYQYDHFLPFYRLFGGQFLATTQESYQFLLEKGLDVVLIPEDAGGTHLDGRHVEKLSDFINQQKADMVLMTDILPEFSQTNFLKKIQPLTFFICHGFSNKDFYVPYRKQVVNDFDYVLSYGPIYTEYLVKKVGVRTNIVKYGLPRLVELNQKIQNQEYVQQLKQRFMEKYQLDGSRKVILFAPTWYCFFASVRDIASEIVRKIDRNEFVVLFRPHPMTPEKYLVPFREMEGRSFIFVGDEDLIELILIADLLLGDDSSVNYDFLVTRKPIVYTWSRKVPRWKVTRWKYQMSWKLTREYWRAVPKIHRWNVSRTNRILHQAFQKQSETLPQIERFIQNCYYNFDHTDYSELEITLNEMVNHGKKITHH